MVESRKRLATILSLDVAGYSRAAERDDEAAAGAVRALRAAIAEIAVSFNGRIFNTAGDGFMLEFPSAASGVQAAQALLAAGTSDAPLPRMRIGLHLGDVIAEDGGDLLGHGVNVAARLQALAEPGTAIVSEAVRAQVRDADDIPFVPLGRVRLDKMNERLAVYALSPGGPVRFSGISRRRFTRAALISGLAATPLAGLAGWWWLQRPRGAQAGTLTLAVLPFDDLGGGPAYLAQGLPRALRDRLARVRGLRVIADTASFSVARETDDIGEIAERLGADLLVGGSLQVDGASVQASADLVDRAGALAWTAQQEGSIEDFGAVEYAISAALIEHLIQVLGPDRIEATLPAAPIDPVVYRMLLEAREIGFEAVAAGMSSPEAPVAVWRRRERIYREVLERDPGNAEALAQLARMAERGQLSETNNTTLFERWELAAAYYRRALQDDPNNSAALSGIGELYRRFEWRWAESENTFQRAIAIDPNAPETRMFYAYLLSTLGRCVEALAQAETAIALEPGFVGRRVAKPRILKGLGRHAEADALYRQELAAAPASVFLLREVFWTLLTRRDRDGLLRLAAHVRDDLWSGAPPEAVAQAIERIGFGADALEGDTTALARAIDAEIAAFDLIDPRVAPYVQSRQNNDLVFGLAVEAAATGNVDKTLDLLERALGLRSIYIPEVLPHGPHEFPPEIRNHPRYQSIWRRDPALAQLAELRRQALRDGQMAARAE